MACTFSGTHGSSGVLGNFTILAPYRLHHAKAPVRREEAVRSLPLPTDLHQLLLTDAAAGKAVQTVRSSTTLAALLRLFERPRVGG